MKESELNALIDQALLDMKNTEAPSAEEASIMAYTDGDYAKMLADIKSEDEDLAELEINMASHPDDEEQPDVDVVSMDNDKFYDKSELSYKGKKAKKTKSDKRMITIGGENLVEKADSNKYDKELIPEMTELDRKVAMTRRIKNSMAERHAKKEQEKIDITRMAFDQKLINLSDGLTRWDKKVVVEELTKNLRILVKKYDEYINRRIAQLLSPAIPAAIKIAKLKWPWTFVANPGFLYKTHPEAGEILTFWATPNVPYYFRQGTEQQILEERNAELNAYLLEAVDRAIHKYYEAQRRLAGREVMYASRFASNTVKLVTYQDLLKYNPFWFKKLYDRIDKERPYDKVTQVGL